MIDDELWALSDTECWDLLVDHRFGRLAYHLGGRVHIVPISYAADRERGQLLFRTAEGSKLSGVLIGSDVAFEIDALEDRLAWSVVVHGSARIGSARELSGVDAQEVMPWVDTDRHTTVVVDVGEVTGRRYPLMPRDG